MIVEAGSVNPINWDAMVFPAARKYSGWKGVIRTDGSESSDTISFSSPQNCPYINDFPDYSPESWMAENSTLIYVRTGSNKQVISDVLVDGVSTINITGVWWQTGYAGWMKPLVFPIIIPENQKCIIQINSNIYSNVSIAYLVENFNSNILNMNVWATRSLDDKATSTVQSANCRLEMRGQSMAYLKQNIPLSNIDVRVDGLCGGSYIKVVLGEPNIYNSSSWRPNHYAFWHYPTWVSLFKGYSDSNNVFVRQQLGEAKKAKQYSQIRIRIVGSTIEFYLDAETTPFITDDCGWMQQIYPDGVRLELYSEGGLGIFDNLRVDMADTPPSMQTLNMDAPETSESGLIITLTPIPDNKTYQYTTGTNVSLYCNAPERFDVSYSIPEENRITNDNPAIIEMNQIKTVNTIISRQPNTTLLKIRNNLGGHIMMYSKDGVVNAEYLYSSQTGVVYTLLAYPEMIGPPNIIPYFKGWLMDDEVVGSAATILVTMDKDHVLEATWTYPVPKNSWYIRSADVMPDTPPAPPIDGPNYDLILDDIVAHNTSLKEINHVLTRLYWCFNLDADPDGNVVKIVENPPLQATVASTRIAIHKIHNHGLKAIVGLVPQWNMIYPSGLSWQGWDSANPSFSIPQFIENYFTNFVIPIAIMCEEEKVERLIISWEMLGWSTNPNFNTLYNQNWIDGMAQVRQVYGGAVDFNVQGFWNTNILNNNHMKMDFLKYVDVIFMSSWLQMNHRPVDARDAAMGIWFMWEGDINANFMNWMNDLSQKHGRQIYLNTGYQTGKNQIFTPWAYQYPEPPRDSDVQMFAWQAALQSMRYQSWCAGYDLEHYNSKAATPDDYKNTTSWRYYESTQKKIFSELHETLISQGLTPPPLDYLPIALSLAIGSLFLIVGASGKQKLLT